MKRYAKTRSQSSPKTIYKLEPMAITVDVKLEPWQTNQLEAIKAAANHAAENGKPGMILGQICGDEMRCGFIEHERAKLLSKHEKTIRTLDDLRKLDKQRKH